MRDMTLPSLSRRQTPEELTQRIFITFRITGHQERNIQGATTKHSEKQHMLDASQSYGKRRSMSRNPPRRRFAPVNPDLSPSRPHHSHR
jgi:hypothetical protein